MTCIKIRHTSTQEYKIIIQPGLLDKCAKLIIEEVPSNQYFLLTVPPLKKLYLANIQNQFKNLGVKLNSKIIKDGEKSKALSTVEGIINYLLAKGANRDSVLIAFGGGVVGDVGGFTASIYMRGIKYIQFATSLIAQVDSSIGGKTGVNSRYGKNLIGSFYQPTIVLIDPNLLITLPETEYLNGLAEVVKYALLDKQIFNLLSRNVKKIIQRDSQSLTKLIIKCCKLKSKIVSADLFDKNIRAVLNLGHTVGHALEKATDYKYFKHGEAIGWGLITACIIAKNRNLITNIDYNRLMYLIKAFNFLKPLPKIDINELLNIMSLDKKKLQLDYTFILPIGIGKVEIFNDVSENEIRRALKEI
jgi:3-dehydroquinate synthase